MTAPQTRFEDPAGEVDISHALAPVQANDLDGQPLRLGTLWEDRPAVLIFLRHFG